MADGELEMELELIRSMYGADEDELTVSLVPDGVSVVSVRLSPQTGGEAAQRFMAATLSLTIPPSYPEDPPSAEIVRARGLVDEEERELSSSLHARAAESAGDCCLIALLQEAVELLTDLNSGGACPVCREPLFEPPGGASDGSCGRRSPHGVYLSGCYHSFHKACLGQWWHSYTEAYAPPASDAGPSRRDAARAEARAAEASASELRLKEDACGVAVEACAERLRCLRAQDDPPAPPAAIATAEDALSRASDEHARMGSRVAKAEALYQKQAAASREADAAQQVEAAAVPLPCPVCRAPIPTSALLADGVRREPPPPEPPSAARWQPPDGIMPAGVAAVRAAAAARDRWAASAGGAEGADSAGEAAASESDSPCALPPGPPPGLGLRPGRGGGRGPKPAPAMNGAAGEGAGAQSSDAGRAGRRRGRGGRGNRGGRANTRSS